MTHRTLTTAAAATLAAFALTLAAFWPAEVRAMKERPDLRPEIALPTLAIDGCQVSLRRLDGKPEAGSPPAVELKVVNPTDQAVELELAVSLMSRQPVSPLSRMIPMPRSLWQQKCRLSAAPGETRRLKLTTNANVPPGHTSHFTLRSGKQAIHTSPVATGGRAVLGANTTAVNTQLAGAALLVQAAGK